MSSPYKRIFEQQFSHSVSENPVDEICLRIVDHIRKGYKLMVLMRGLPGSGKTSLARTLVERGLGAVNGNEFIFSTHDYFYQSGRYAYNPNEFQEAHVWNQRRAFASATRGSSPIIVDDNNLEISEMKVYCTMAVQFGYLIEIVKVETPWALDPKDLSMKNVHGVSEEEIESMLERYEQDVTLQQLLEDFGLVYRVSLPQYREYPSFSFSYESKESFPNKEDIAQPVVSSTLPSPPASILSSFGENKERMDARTGSRWQKNYTSDSSPIPPLTENVKFTKKDSQIEGLLVSHQLEELNKTILKQSEEIKAMRSEIMRYVTFISGHSEEMKETSLKQSEEMTEMRSEIIEYVKFLTADTKTKVTFVAEQLVEMKEMMRLRPQRSQSINSPSSAKVKSSESVNWEKDGSIKQPQLVQHSGGYNKLQDILEKGNVSLTKLLAGSSTILRRKKTTSSKRMTFSMNEKDQMQELIKLYPNVPPECIANVYHKCRSNLHWTTEVLNFIFNLLYFLGEHCSNAISSIAKASGINFEAYTNGLITVVIIVIILHIYILFL